MNEIKGDFNDVLIVSELRGQFPNVAIASDVDYAGLIAGDDNPVFLTIPIGKAGVTSGNKRHYDEPWLQELERQTLARKPTGLMGHLSAAERAHAMPPEAIFWVGAQRVGDVLWGKGYLPPGEARQRIQRFKAHNKPIATSIDAYAEGVWDDKLDAYRMNPSTLKLNQIDIAPADRAGIPALAEVPQLTTEMENKQAASDGGPSSNKDNKTMDKLQVIQELSADDARLLPDSVRAAILATVATPAEVGLVTELRQALGVDGKADLAAVIAGLVTEQATQRKAAVTGRIKELVEDKEKGIKLESARPIVLELINARNPATVAEAEAAFEAVKAAPAVVAMLAATVQETMGPRQSVAANAAANATQPKWYSIPEVAAH